jgi:hypothetical protein
MLYWAYNTENQRLILVELILIRKEALLGTQNCGSFILAVVLPSSPVLSGTINAYCRMMVIYRWSSITNSRRYLWNRGRMWRAKGDRGL